jgi:hypothetical protein
MEDVLGEDHVELRRGKGTRDTNGTLRTTSERILEIDKKLCALFFDWQKASHRVKQTKLMQVLKTATEWREMGLSSKLYTDKGVKV